MLWSALYLPWNIRLPLVISKSFMFILPPPSFSFKVVLPSPPSLSSDTSSSPDFVISPLYWLYPTIYAHSPPLKSPFLLSASEGIIDYIFTHKALELETTHERGCEIYSVYLPATFFRDKYYSIDKNEPRFHYPFVFWRAFGLFSLLDFVKSLTVRTCFTSIHVVVSRHVCAYATRHCDQSSDRFSFSFLKILHTDFQSDCSDLQAQWQATWLLLSPEPGHHFLSVISILTGVRWHLHIILIWIWCRHLASHSLEASWSVLFGCYCPSGY